MNDMINAYLILLEADQKKINQQIFNIGSKNHTVTEIADIVKKIIGKDVKLTKIQSDDNRSYHISSDKIYNHLGFKTQFTIGDAVRDLRSAFEKKKLINTFENINFFNIKKMQSINLK